MALGNMPARGPAPRQARMRLRLQSHGFFVGLSGTPALQNMCLFDKHFCPGKIGYMRERVRARVFQMPPIERINPEFSEEPGKQFHTTHWSVVIAAGDAGSDHAEAALARLCQTYWFPVYAFIRKRGHSPEQAQDFTQEFFTGFLAKNYVAKAARERGRFRVFLMSSVENFLHNQHDKEQAQKRGGGLKLLSLDYQDAEERFRVEPVEEIDPAKIFEQQWAATLLETVLGRLKDEFAAEGRAGLFDDLQTHLWGDAASIPYPQLAAKCGLTASNVKTIAHRFRQRYRELLREEIAQTVAKPGEVDDEIRHLMRIVSQ